MTLKKLKLTRFLNLSLLGLLMIFYSFSCKNEKEQKKVPEVNVKKQREIPHG